MKPMATRNPPPDQPLGEKYPGAFIGFAIFLVVFAETLVEWLL